MKIFHILKDLFMSNFYHFFSFRNPIDPPNAKWKKRSRQRLPGRVATALLEEGEPIFVSLMFSLGLINSSSENHFLKTIIFFIGSHKHVIWKSILENYNFFIGSHKHFIWKYFLDDLFFSIGLTNNSSEIYFWKSIIFLSGLINSSSENHFWKTIMFSVGLINSSSENYVFIGFINTKSEYYFCKTILFLWVA